MTLSGELKKLTPVVTFLPHCWLLCSRMQSYRGLPYSTEILFIDCFSAKEKSSSFSVERERNYLTQPLKISGMWPREFTILVWQAKPRDESRQRFRGKIIFHTYFWIRGLPVLVLVVFPLRRAPSVSSSLKPCANERLNVGQQLHVACYLYCVRLRTLLHVVGSCCEKFETSQTFEPTLLTFLFSSVIAET